MKKKIYHLHDAARFTRQSWQWAMQFSFFAFLDHNGHTGQFLPFPKVLAADASVLLQPQPGNEFESLAQFQQQHRAWMFGFLSYDLKNSVEHLTSSHPDRQGFPLMHFFVPRHLVHFDGNTAVIESETPDEIFAAIASQPLPAPLSPDGLQLQHGMSREEYLEKVQAIRTHIENGDIYELNFCQEFFVENARISPPDVFEKLNSRSPMPFAAFLRAGEHFLMCASPERFLKKTGSTLISQPIKGTIRRGINPAEDELLKAQLRSDEKEIAENMMIVDLVRNDLARSSVTGTIKVPELFGIYTFAQVHQMISTVTSQMREDVSFARALQNAFPMGSMTGAPKIRAMELIEQYETMRRGLYSGAVGYVSPEGDFDFNVVIRSVLYNAESNYLSFCAGSAITYDSVAKQEYEECLLKAKAIREILFN